MIREYRFSSNMHTYNSKTNTLLRLDVKIQDLPALKDSPAKHSIVHFIEGTDSEMLNLDEEPPSPG